MTYYSHDDIIRRWVAVTTGRTSKPVLNPKGANVFSRGDVLYSYGEHFELARAVRDKRGTVTHFLVNGDTYSVTTSRHQAEVRSAITHSGVPSVIIPHQALAAAGIRNLDTVAIVAVSQDTWTEHVVRTINVLPDDAEWRTEIVGQRHGYVHRETGEPMPDGVYQWTPRGADYVYSVIDPGRQEQRLYVKRSNWERYEVIEDERGTVYQRTYRQHHLGESVITADVPYTTSARCRSCGGFGRRPGPAERLVNDEHPVWSIDQQFCATCRGNGVLGTHRTRRATFLSGFDEQETRPAYFFCELPRGAKVTTIADAREALKPESVVIAERLGRTVLRQGDVFMVPVPRLTTRELRKAGATITKASFVLGVNHRATEVAVATDGLTFARGTMTHDPGQWRRPDHKRVAIGRSWHLVTKNTVPITR